MSEFIKLGDTVRIGFITENISGVPQTADETPSWRVFANDSDTQVLTGDFSQRTNFAGRYRSNFDASTGNGFITGYYYEVHASGKVNGLHQSEIVKEFVLDDVYNANIVQVSGEPNNTYINANVISISGVPVIPTNVADDVWDSLTSEHTTSGTYGLALASITNNVYYADIRYILDGTNLQDEYAVQWFRNDQALASGDFTNPAISVYRTSDGTAIFENEIMNLAGTSVGTVRYNDAPNVLSSGEPYLVKVSATIDSVTRTWQAIVGVNIL